jgi:glyoxylase-like metal-dependent hydrolase (beta-lactamase superfamily II)
MGPRGNEVRANLGDLGAELAPGLWRWTAFHPAWKQEVASLAYEDAGDLVLIDPLAPFEPAEARRFWRALDTTVREREQPLDVLLTIHWHERHVPEVLDRYSKRPGAALWSLGATVERSSRAPDHAFAIGDRLPAGILALDAGTGDEVVLWLPRARALVAGDVLLGGKRKPLRVCPQSWLPRGVARSDVAKTLRALLDLPVEVVVPTHGEPIRDDAHAVLAGAIDEAV